MLKLQWAIQLQLVRLKTLSQNHIIVSLRPILTESLYVNKQWRYCTLSHYSCLESLRDQYSTRDTRVYNISHIIKCSIEHYLYNIYYEKEYSQAKIHASNVLQN